MLQLKIRVHRDFFYILTGLIVWTAAGIVPFLLLFDQVMYGGVSALLAVMAAILMVARHRAPSGEVYVLQSAILLIMFLSWILLPLLIVVLLAKYIPLQYSALILVYVLGIVALVIAAAVRLRRGVIQHRQEQGSG